MDIKIRLRRFFFGSIYSLYAGVLHTLLSSFSLQPEPRLIIDATNTQTCLPKHFRTSLDPLTDEEANSEGLRSLNIAGSGQFSARELKEAIAKIGSDPAIWLIDLRQECHCFLNGIAISLYAKHNAANFGKSLEQCASDERAMIQTLRHEKEITLHTAKPYAGKVDEPQEIEVLSCVSEEELAKSQGVTYVRLPVTDHMTPDAKTVDRFLQLVQTVPSNCWLYFHCRGGDGRTSSFMIMYDMLKNAKTRTFEEILTRQWHLGGKNLGEVPDKCNWRSFRKEERYYFLHQFYDYCRQKDPNSTQTFSDWLHNRAVFAKL